ncbi:unnamed protein product [Heligmosomoides polygyrus]|uniref:Zf-C3Hc3H domain-containing protein n=1 Tax=Heligmosomoides polygyrus TaxID=6339 RepID=A0A183FWK8_HELPZ|nr:unnamed protein product [Heligmosomoides polygyrus]
MADSIDWSNSEPPNRYVLAYGTQHCLIEQDYDHSVYEECSYVSSRTLVKCKSVRKKEDLRANGGVCEMHKKFYDSIKERFLCEERRLMQDNGQGKPKYSRFINQDGLISRTLVKCKSVRKKEDLRANGGVCEMHKKFYDSIKERFLCEERRLMQDNGQGKPKYSRFINQDGLISEEYPWLMQSYRWESPLPRTVYDDAPDDDPVAPLRNAGVFTEKDILKMRKALLEKKIEYLTLHGEMMVERARRRAHDLFGNNRKVVTLDESAAAIAAACASLDNYGSTSKRIALLHKYKTGEWERKEPPFCSFGRQKSDNDEDVSAVVASVVNAVLDCCDEEKDDIISYQELQESREPKQAPTPVEEVEPCSRWRIPQSDYCDLHIVLDERQCLFVPCSVCHSMCVELGPTPLCSKHLKEFSKVKRAPSKDARMPGTPMLNLSSGVPPISPLSIFKSTNDPSKPLFGLPSSSSSSPFPTGSLTDRRTTKRVSVDAPPGEENELAKRIRPDLTLGEVVSQGQSPALQEAIRRAELRRGRDEEVCGCARIRPFERSQFPAKSSVPRRISVGNRVPVPVRRPSGTADSSGQIHSPQPSYSSGALSRHGGGSETGIQRQHALLPAPRRTQPLHRHLDLRPAPVNIPLNPRPSSASTSTSYIDASGNEVLVEDRRTPPYSQGQQNVFFVSDASKSRMPSSAQTRPFISSYRRPIHATVHRQPSGSQQLRDGTSNSETSRAHVILPPPPDPPILPPSGSVRSSIAPTEDFGVAAEETRAGGSRTGQVPTATSSPRAGGPLGRSGPPDSESASSDQDVQLLAPPPPPPILRPRYPGILRKPDGPSTPSPLPVLPQPPPSSATPQRAAPPSAPLPRPPPASRPLPPHRLLNPAVRPLPPHRLIKTLPLPVVPAPRAPKPATSSDSTTATAATTAATVTTATTTTTTATTNTVEEPKETPPAERISPSKIAQTSRERALARKADELSSADLDPLRILAAVSEAARDSAASASAAAAAAAAAVSVQQSKPAPSTAESADAADDDDEFEEEL